MMRTPAFLALCWLATTACGDNSDPNVPPELIEPQITMTMSKGSMVTVDTSAYDPERGTLSYSASQPQHGTVTGSGPIFTYMPNASFVGEDDFTVTISDGKNTTDVPIQLVITAVDDAPVAPHLELVTSENEDLAITLAATDADSPQLIYELVTEPAHGTLNGTLPQLTYTPDVDYLGDDSFTYRASDGQLDSNTATVAISVLGPI